MKSLIIFVFILFFSFNLQSQNTMILDNLETPGISSQGQNWAFFTDGVMGGLSQGKAIISKVNDVNCYHMTGNVTCLLYTSPSPRDGLLSRMPSSA